jgi:hypothetical protein
MNTMTNTHLSQLLVMPQAEFERYHAAVSQIAEWRTNEEAPPPPAPAAVPRTEIAAPAKPPTAALPRRSPMRAPQADSLRGAVHEVLRTAGRPLRRAEIVSAVAAQRGESATDQFVNKVGDILINRHDPFIFKVKYGTYTHTDAQQ